METKKTIPLRTALVLNDKSWTAFELEEPDGDQLAKAFEHENVIDRTIMLIAETSKIPPAIVRKAKQTEIMEAVRFFESFMSAGATDTGAG